VSFFRKALLLLGVSSALAVVAAASDLVLTGLAATGGRVRAFLSTRAPSGTGAFSVSLHQESLGVRLVSVNLRERTALISEDGVERRLCLGGETAAGDPLGSGVVNTGGLTTGLHSISSQRSAADPIVDNGRAVSDGTGVAGSTGPDGVRVESNIPARSVSGDGSGTPPGSSNSELNRDDSVAHRWVPGMVREPTEAELFKAKYGASALEERARQERYAAGLRRTQ